MIFQWNTPRMRYIAGAYGLTWTLEAGGGADALGAGTLGRARRKILMGRL